MIISKNFLIDLGLHTVLIYMLYVIFIYIRKLSLTNAFLTSFIIALVVTYINHTQYPQFRLRRYLKL